jgi:hypothetical protein
LFDLSLSFDIFETEITESSTGTSYSTGHFDLILSSKYEYIVQTFTFVKLWRNRNLLCAQHISQGTTFGPRISTGSSAIK